MVKNTTFSIEEELLEQFKEVCRESAINQSAWIVLKMKELIKEHKLIN